MSFDKLRMSGAQQRRIGMVRLRLRSVFAYGFFGLTLLRTVFFAKFQCLFLVQHSLIGAARRSCAATKTGAESRTRTGTSLHSRDFKSLASTYSAIPAHHFNPILHGDPTEEDIFLEAAPGFEPGIKVLQTRALPLGYAAIHKYFNSIKFIKHFKCSIKYVFCKLFHCNSSHWMKKQPKKAVRSLHSPC